MKQMRAGRVFFLGLAMYLLCILPFMVYRGGIWVYYGDYNIQQVPFYIMCHRMVKSGFFYWNPLLDLGSDIGAAFSMYLWGSPFFWITIPFPESWIPNLMPVLMALKYGTALAAAYLWLRTKTKTENGALLGAFLYAFSGFQGTNIVFAHFHDVTAFFPLYLLSLDRAAQKKKYALPVFSLMTAFMLILSYYFFFGQVIFLILYYVVRCVPAGDFGGELKRMGQILLAGLLGGGLSAVFWVRLLTGVFGNSRLGNVLSGYDLFCYPDQTTIAAILKSFFMLPDPAGRGTLFTNDAIRVSSLAGYLPCFALTGVVAYFITHRRDRKKRLLLVFALMALVPVLNASFSAFNTAFYARWYYMPILLMAEITAIAMEEHDRAALGRGAAVSIIAACAFMLCALAPAEVDGETVAFGLIRYPEILFAQYIVTGILFLPLLYMVYAGGPGDGTDAKDAQTAGLRMPRRAVTITALCCMLSTCGALWCGTTIVSQAGSENWQRQMFHSDPVPEARGTFFRVETDGSSTNYDMVWGYPQLHAFQSTVSPAIFRFYRGIGLIRSVESTLPMEKEGARAILSGRYYLENLAAKARTNYTEEGGIEGYRLAQETAEYNIYENENYIPMGFTFDRYMTEKNYKSLPGETADRLLVKDLVLSEENAARYGYLMEEDTDTEQDLMTMEEFEAHCDARSKSACTRFSYDRDGYTAQADLPAKSLVFFSVPYDKGFSAYVDGVRTQIIEADFGLTAVLVPQGKHEIRLFYRPYGLAAGAAASALSAAALIALFFAERRRRILNKNSEKCYDNVLNAVADARASMREEERL